MNQIKLRHGLASRITLYFILLILLALSVNSVPVIAAPLPISVDMDPTTAGIQNTLNVQVGDTFTVDVLISDDGVAPSPVIFDAVILEAYFNDAKPAQPALPRSGKRETQDGFLGHASRDRSAVSRAGSCSLGR